MAYFPKSKEVVYSFSTAMRRDGVAILEMNSKKGTAETWIGFLSADEKNAANSVYRHSQSVGDLSKRQKAEVRMQNDFSGLPTF